MALLAACAKDKAKPATDPSPTSAKPSADQPSPTAATPGKIPITTKSPEARAAYETGLKLANELRVTDAHAKYEAAVAKDPDFALAHLGLANTAPNNAAFFTELDKAVALAANVSPAEQEWIKAAEAGAKNDPETQLAALTKLVELAPQDPQAQTLLGQFHFGRQHYDEAITAFTKAIAIDPKFSAPYNQLGYAYRFADRLDDSEQTFKKYIELIPNDPNPYDSYAELLMKRGKYDESIASYEKALAIDPNFIASYIGIGNNHMFAGRGDQAREAFAKVTKAARNMGEQRQALFWTSVSYVHEGKWSEAIAALDKSQAIAVANKDLGLEAQDHALRATYLLESGKPDAALAEFEVQQDTLAKSSVPDPVKEQGKRNHLANEARVALAKRDLATAKAKLDEYGKLVDARQLPFEVRQRHELAGMLAIEDKRFADAVAELAKANDQDPRVLYLRGVAAAGSGDKAKAKEWFQKAADWNALGVNYAYVRAKAKKALGA